MKSSNKTNILRNMFWLLSFKYNRFEA